MSTLKDALATALQGSPLKKSLNERLWLYIRDNPDVLSIQMPSILKEDKKDVSRAVHNLRLRQMVLGTAEYIHRANGPRMTYRLKVNPAMRGLYEAWPVKKIPGTFRPQRTKVPLKQELSILSGPPEASKPQEGYQSKTLADFKEYDLTVKVPQSPRPVRQEASTGLVVATLPLAEARRIFDELAVFFKVSA